MTFPSRAYAGMPYQVFGKRSGAVSDTISWTFFARVRSAAGILAIAARRSFSPAARSRFARSSAFNSFARALIAACSAAENLPVDFFVEVGIVTAFLGCGPCFLRGHGTRSPAGPRVAAPALGRLRHPSPAPAR